jgi:hypothetical protein
MSATDNVTPSASLVKTQSPARGTLLGLGTYSIIVTVKDAAGNTSTCSTPFTVVDNVPPVIISCAPSKSASGDSVTGTAAAPNLVSYVYAKDDQPGTLTITQSPIAGAQLPIGVNPITITVKDVAGNISTCTAMFTVTDCTAPVILSCAPSITNTPAANGRTPIPDFTGSIQARDNSGSYTVTQSPAAGTTTSCSGKTTIKLTVKDVAGNYSTCTTTFVAQDIVDPVITSCAPAITVNAGSNGKASIPSFLGSVSASDDSGSVTLSQTPKAGTSVTAGTYQIVIKAKDSAGNYTTCNTTFTVNAATAKPSVDCSVSVGTLWNADNSLVNVGFTATGHNYSGSVQVKVYSNLDDVSASSSHCGGDRDDGDDDDDDDWNFGNYWSHFNDGGGYCNDGNYACSNYSPDAKGISATGGLRLRAERPGSSTGRVYLIVATVSNSSGQTATCTSTVIVPNGSSSCNLTAKKAQQAQAYFAAYGQPPASYFVVGDGPTLGSKQ